MSFQEPSHYAEDDMVLVAGSDYVRMASIGGGVLSIKLPTSADATPVVESIADGGFLAVNGGTYVDEQRLGALYMRESDGITVPNSNYVMTYNPNGNPLKEITYSDDIPNHLNIIDASFDIVDASFSIIDTSFNVHDVSLNTLDTQVTNLISQGGGGASFGSTIAIGSGSNATGTNSVAIGNNASTSTYDNSVALGNGSTAGADNSIILGDGTQSVGIGTSNPSTQLDIYSNEYIGIKNMLNILHNYDNTDTGGGTYTDILANIQASGNPSQGGAGDTLIGLNVDVGPISNITYNYAALFNGGNVGIGTTSPESKLHVKDGPICIERTFGDSGNLEPGIVFLEDHASNDCFYIAYDAGGTGQSEDEGLVFYSKSGGGANPTGGTQIMTMRGNGRVGIGESNPDNILHVRGNGPQLLLEGQSNENAIIRFSAGPSYGDKYHEIVNEFYALSGNGYRNKMHFKVNEGGNFNSPGTRMTITGDGFVGINTTTPNDYAALAVRHHKWTNRGGESWAKTFSSAGATGGGSSNQDYSIHANKVIYCNQLHTASDRRIKKNILDVNDDSALEMLRLIKPKTYQYVDIRNRGDITVYGFIAQEIKEIIPHAVNNTTEVIPNMYEVAEIIQDTSGIFNIIKFSVFDTQNLIYDSSNNLNSTLQIVDKDDNVVEVEINEIIDEKKMKVSLNLSDLVAEKDSKYYIFVNGQRTSEFNSLKKDAIWTVATAALQEVDRQLQAEKAKTATLETKVSSLESQLSDILSRLSTLENP